MTLDLPAVACAVIDDGAGGGQHSVRSSVDFLLAIRSRRNSLGQEAPDLTFDGTLIDNMSFDILRPENSAATRVTSANVDKGTASDSGRHRIYVLQVDATQVE